MSRQRNGSLIMTCGLLAQVSFAVTPIANPMQYAEQNSKSFAEGDANDNSGWQGCEYQPSGADTIAIECRGSRQILIHGGEMVTGSFVCNYEFEAAAGGYAVLAEECVGGQ